MGGEVGGAGRRARPIAAPALQATSLLTALRRHTDVAVANLIGSNGMNTPGILGVAGAITLLPFLPELAGADMMWMPAATILIFPLMRMGMRMNRGDGALLLVFYARMSGWWWGRGEVSSTL